MASRRTVQRSSVGAAERRDVLTQCLGPFLGHLHGARADDDPVGELRGGTRMLRRRDAEAGVERHVHQPAGPLGKAGERGGEVSARPGRAGQRDEVEPAVRLAPASAIRSSVDVGATSWMRRVSGRSPAGRSAMIMLVAPAAVASSAKRSQPYASSSDE